jgi:hypothetical protein
MGKGAYFTSYCPWRLWGVRVYYIVKYALEVLVYPVQFFNKKGGLNLGPARPVSDYSSFAFRVGGSHP